MAAAPPLALARNADKTAGMADNIRFLIGVDGGGTSCRVAVASLDGTVLGKSKTGSSNIRTDMDGAAQNILSAAAGAFAEAGLDPDEMRNSAAVLGLAGANVGDFAKRLSKRLPFARHSIDSDATIALQGALGDGDGAIAILGTGSAYLARQDETLKLSGGWGFQLSDLGGGARLGRDALEAALLAHDGVIAMTELTRELIDGFEHGPDGILDFALTAAPADYGRYAPAVLSHAEKGDANAVRLFTAAASHVDAALDAACGNTINRVALLGGLAPFYPKWLAERHQARLVPARADALTGAVELAAKLATHGDHGAGRAKR